MKEVIYYYTTYNDISHENIKLLDTEEEERKLLIYSYIHNYYLKTTVFC